MSISRKMLGLVAALTALGCVAATASLPATAATPACGAHCASIFSKLLGNYTTPGVVESVLGGLAERAGDSPDSFWTWRDLMYRVANRITPEQMEAVAAQLYAECLRHPRR